jgi:purine-binding chemotaxis protein CheW
MSGVENLVLVARVAGERVAIPASEIESVVELGALVPVPRAARHVAGLAALRSRVLTVIDCYAALGLARPDGHASRSALIIETDGHPYALLVDSVEDVVNVTSGVRPANRVVKPAWLAVSRGTIAIEDKMLLFVDPAKLIAGPALQAA